jgi:hypothetical protein
MSYKVPLQASSTGLLNQQPALAQQHNNEIQSFFSRLLDQPVRPTDGRCGHTVAWKRAAAAGIGSGKGSCGR